MGGAWLWLGAAGACEVVWVVLLRQTEGFTRLWPSAAVILLLAASFYAMSQSLRHLPMGTVYAVWTGIGAAGALLWGVLVLGEPAGALRILCIVMILAGVVGLRLG